MPTADRPPYIRLISADERATLPYRVEDICRGITPQELYERERRLRVSVLAAYEAIKVRHGECAGIRFLDGCVSEGLGKRYRAREDGWIYSFSFSCLIAGIEDRIYRAIIAWISEAKGVPQRQLKAELRAAEREEKDLGRRRTKQCRRDCGCFEAGMSCGLTGRIYPGDRKTLQQ